MTDATLVVGGLFTGAALFLCLVFLYRKCRRRQRVPLPSLDPDERRFRRRLEQIDAAFDDGGGGDEDDGVQLTAQELEQLKQLEVELARKGKLGGKKLQQSPSGSGATASAPRVPAAAGGGGGGGGSNSDREALAGASLDADLDSVIAAVDAESGLGPGAAAAVATGSAAGGSKGRPAGAPPAKHGLGKLLARDARKASVD